MRFGMTVSLLRGRARTLGLLRLDTSDRTPHFLDARCLFKLAGCRLEAEVERLALQFAKLFGELVVGLGLEIDRKSTRLTSSHYCASRMPSSACTQQTQSTSTTTYVTEN